MKTTKDPSRKKKPLTGPSRAQLEQIRKPLQCILGCCGHDYTSRTCLYWKKVVDAADPAEMQLKLIMKLFKEKL